MKVVSDFPGTGTDVPRRGDDRRTATFASMTAVMSACAGPSTYTVRPMH